MCVLSTVDSSGYIDLSTVDRNMCIVLLCLLCIDVSNIVGNVCSELFTVDNFVLCYQRVHCVIYCR